MNLIPAIDLLDGKCVQLKRGLRESATQYADDAGALARHWVDCGARRIHVVDLDGAFNGYSVNTKAIEEIVVATGDVPVELGGGIRDRVGVKSWLEVGIDQVILGTQAIEDFDFFAEAASSNPQRIILGLDALGDFVSTRGWKSTSKITVTELLQAVEELPLHSVIFTDTQRDGMLSGIHVDANRNVLTHTSQSVVASGGVRSLNDLHAVRALKDEFVNLVGVISGSALYEKQLDFQEAQQLLDGET